SFGPMLGPLSELKQKLLVRGNDRRVGFISRMVEGMTGIERSPDWVSGACLMVRRADAVAARLLDERYFMYEEAVDFCPALRARGRRILFTPRVQVVHLRGRSARQASNEVAAAYRSSHLLFYEKHRPGWAPLLRLYLRLRHGKP